MAEIKESNPVEGKSGVTLISAYKAVWKKYADFTGRLSRKGFWYFILVNALVGLVLSILDRAIFKAEPGSSYRLAPLSYIYSLAILLPTLAASTRRLHDINKSGWFQLLGLIPLVGQIILLVFYFQKGDQVENQYGPVPHE